MRFSQCTHLPHAIKITFDIGDAQMEVYQLCKFCKELDVFRDFILSKEVLSEKTQVTEIDDQERPKSIPVVDVINSG